jgi:hypothetical protein
MIMYIATYHCKLRDTEFLHHRQHINTTFTLVLTRKKYGVIHTNTSLLQFLIVFRVLCEITMGEYKYYVFGHYPSSCPFFKKPQRFGDWILSPSSGR